MHLGDIVGVTGHADQVPPRRAVADRRQPRGARQHPHAAAGHVPRPHRRRAALPPPLLDLLMNEETRATSCCARAWSPRSGAGSTRRGSSRSRRRCCSRGTAARSPPFSTASQRARPDALPAHRHRAVPQAADRRRARARLRARQGLPQRGRLLQAQPRVHDARVVRGLRRLPRHDGPHGAARRRRWPKRRSGRTTVTFRGHEIDLGTLAARQARPTRSTSTASGRTTRPSCGPD